MKKEEGIAGERRMEGKEKKNYERENTDSIVSPVKALAPSGDLTGQLHLTHIPSHRPFHVLSHGILAFSHMHFGRTHKN